MKTHISLAAWNRAEHYNFYKDFAEPYFGLTTQLECGNLHKLAKETGTSFFLRYMHASGWAVNQIENFRYRQEGDQIALYDQVNISTTVGRADTTFGFSFIPYAREWPKFLPAAVAEVERVKNGSGLSINSNTGRADTVHYSTIPWAKFSSISNARPFDNKPDSIPKILFGKCSKERGKTSMPVAVYVNHALADAYHIGQYLEALQEAFNNPLS